MLQREYDIIELSTVSTFNTCQKMPMFSTIPHNIQFYLIANLHPELARSFSATFCICDKSAVEYMSQSETKMRSSTALDLGFNKQYFKKETPQKGQKLWLSRKLCKQRKSMKG